MNRNGSGLNQRFLSVVARRLLWDREPGFGDELRTRSVLKILVFHRCPSDWLRYSGRFVHPPKESCRATRSFRKGGCGVRHDLYGCNGFLLRPLPDQHFAYSWSYRFSRCRCRVPDRVVLGRADIQRRRGYVHPVQGC